VSGLHHQNSNTHYLFPGTIFAHKEQHLVTTVLGSCVAVCLWHPGSGIGGINHYLLPLWNGEGLPTPKYGNIAITRLIEKIRQLTGKGELVAKVFGGASMWARTEGALAVGERNVELAFRLLAEENIQVVSQDVWGEMGRKIIFDTKTGSVLLRRNPNVAMRARLAEDIENSSRS
jgi:chemotaxis protein CheD